MIQNSSFRAKSKNHQKLKNKKMKTKILPKPQNAKIHQKADKKMFWEQKSSCQRPNPAQNDQKSCCWSKTLLNPSANFWSICVPATLFPILIFALGTIWRHQWIDLDLICPYLFFRFHCGSYNVPNDRFCFSILVIFLNKIHSQFWSILHIFAHFWL